MKPKNKNIATKELLTFLAVGFSSVGIDFLTYRGLLFFYSNYDFGKSIGFIVGAVFAYFANKIWTFGHVDMRRGSHLRFVAVYLCGFGANVLINRIALQVLPFEEGRFVVAFVLATGVSAALNFIGMKFFVFTRAPSIQEIP